MSRAMHFCGRMFASGSSAEPALALQVEKCLSDNDITLGVGSLACGADILFAEALINRGADLFVVLPFDEVNFCRTSVAIGGKDWVPRFDRCLANAQANTILDEGQTDAAFATCSRVAMAQAFELARTLNMPPIQIAIFDGVPSANAAGTAGDIRKWANMGGETFIIEAPGHLRLNAD